MAPSQKMPKGGWEGGGQKKPHKQTPHRKQFPTLPVTSVRKGPFSRGFPLRCVLQTPPLWLCPSFLAVTNGHQPWYVSSSQQGTRGKRIVAPEFHACMFSLVHQVEAPTCVGCPPRDLGVRLFLLFASSLVMCFAFLELSKGSEEVH